MISSMAFILVGIGIIVTNRPPIRSPDRRRNDPEMIDGILLRTRCNTGGAFLGGDGTAPFSPAAK
jgi:hypothetical protein